MSEDVGIDHYAIRDFCTIWCGNLGLDVPQHDAPWIEVVKVATKLIGKSWGGGKHPSPFKRAAATGIAIVAVAPIESHIPKAIIEREGMTDQMATQPRILKALVAHSLAEFILQNSQVGNDVYMRKLDRRLLVSDHLLKDLLWQLATSDIDGDRDVCGPIALIYEVCTYHANLEAPDLPYWAEKNDRAPGGK